MNKWFIQSQELVKGPFTSDDVQDRLSSGEFRSTDLIWGPAQEEWRQLHWWVNNFNSLMAEVTQIAPIQEWHYSINGQTVGPLSRLELVHALKGVKGMGDILLWTSGMVSWAPIFEFVDLLNEVGVSRREFPRAEIIGKATLKLPNGTSVDADMISVGEGGFGVSMGSGILPGQIVTVDIHSPALRDVVHAKVECRYIVNGVTGFRFAHISAEYKSTIVQYVKQSQARAGMASSQRRAA